MIRQLNDTVSLSDMVRRLVRLRGALAPSLYRILATAVTMRSGFLLNVAEILFKFRVLQEAHQSGFFNLTDGWRQSYHFFKKFAKLCRGNHGREQAIILEELLHLSVLGREQESFNI